MSVSEQAEFSRPVVVARLGQSEAIETIEAADAERARLAKRLGIVALNRFVAVVRLRRREGGEIIHVSGRLEADLVQNCVVTLEPFPSLVEDSFSVDFTELPVAEEDEAILDMDHEPPEPIADGIIDIGEVATQYLALALDPHPRAPGVSLDSVWSGEGNPESSPFAALAKLKSRG